MRRQLRIGSGLCWVLAWLGAILPGVLYLAGHALPWWVGMAMFAPLVALAVWRAERTGSWTVPDGAGPQWAP